MAKGTNIAISAAAFSGNQGAASMLHATIQQLSTIGDVEFSVFTVYPQADTKVNPYKNVKIYSATPKRLVTTLIPLAFVHRLLPFARGLTNKVDGVKALYESDFQIDLAGISFADGRRVFLIYNIASVLPAMIMGKPVIKFAQAMGQFKDVVNKLVASVFLPRFKQIFARGAETRASLDKLKLTNVSDASDVAFLFKPSESEKKSADALRRQNKLKKGEYVTVSPSRVLYKKSEKAGIDYIKQTAEYIDWLIKDQKQTVLLMAHSSRDDIEKLHNNDIPVCNEIYRLVKNKQQCVLPDRTLLAGELKQLIADSKIVVAARFHAMISSLSVGTPVVVTGWSHKYQEVLDSFKLNVPVVYLDKDYRKHASGVTLKALRDRDELAKQIDEQIATIKDNAQKQIAYVTEFIRKAS